LVAGVGRLIKAREDSGGRNWTGEVVEADIEILQIDAIA